MLQRTTNNSSDLGDAVLSAITQCGIKVRDGKEAERRRNELRAEHVQAIKLAQRIKDASDYMVKMYKNILHYSNELKAENKARLQNAIALVSEVVPSADVGTMSLHMEDGKARLLVKGHDVNKREGSAARATISILSRFGLLKSQPNKLQVLLLDEHFGTLGPESIVNMRDILSEMSKTMLIVVIEQHGLLCEGFSDRVVYEFTKTNGVTRVHREV
jgi:DNA repair exonuclease SbcCD ATPase subunit